MAAMKSSVNKTQALAIAERSAQELGWYWAEPVTAKESGGWFWTKRQWTIESNCEARGARARFVIDAESGAVIERGFVGR